MISVGAFAPLGKDSLQQLLALDRLDVVAKPVAGVRPVLKFSRPSDSTSSSATTPTQIRRGRSAIAIAEPSARGPRGSLAPTAS